MLDGHTFFSDPGPRPLPARPAPLDARAVLPMLRAEAAEVAVEFLAHAAGANAVATARWLALNWGAEADLRDHRHPARAAAQEPSSPAWKLAEAQVMLDTACRRYRIATGRDGLALARKTIDRLYGTPVADYALKPLIEAAARSSEIDAIIAGDTPEPELLPRAPEPTPAQRKAGIEAMADWWLSHPEMGDLSRRLDALLAACEAEGRNQHAQATAGALEAVKGSIRAALERGAELESMQFTLNLWAKATGGPQINLSTDAPPAG
jgi:hypothetical protein